MPKTPNYDAKVKSILDAIQPGDRVCELTGEKWVMDEEEIGWYKKFNVPPSKRSPLTRMKNICGFFVMYQFWYQTHPETGKKFITVVHPASGFKALPDPEWFGNDYSSVTRDIDLEVPGLDMILSLQKEIPFPGTKFLKEPINSISLASLGDVNSYFVMACRSRNAFYSADALDIEDVAEVSMSTQVKESYHVVQSHRIYKSNFILESRDCITSSFLFDCHNCEFCFGATNKRNRKYLWFNEQLSKEEWERRMADVNLSSSSKLEDYRRRFHDLMVEQAIWPDNFGEKCTNVIGNHVNNATDCSYVFNGLDGPFRDLHYCTYCYGNSYDCVFVGAPVSANTCYYTNTPVNASRVKFSHFTPDCQNVEYSSYCFNCENCFGCVGLRYKKFYIFNKEYSEEVYWNKLDEVKCAMLDRGEYGEMLPLSFAPTYLPDGGGPMVYMMKNEELEKLGGTIYPPDSEGASGVIGDVGEMKTVDDVPDRIDDMGDDWAGIPIYDPEYKRRFAYVKPELGFYRKLRIAAPRTHFVKRVLNLIMEQGSAIFFETTCGKCKTSVITTKHKDYPSRTIYCRTCYLHYLEQHG